MSRLIIVFGGMVVLIVAAAGAWYIGSPLFISQAVDEPFPFELPSQATMSQMSEAEIQELRDNLRSAIPNPEAMAQMSAEERQALEDQVMKAALALPDKAMDEATPTDPIALRQGQFQDADSFHQGSGTATIYELPDQSRLLRFESFNVTNGPDLHVLLATNPTPTSRDDLGEYLDLGSIKGNVGNQNYTIPTDADLTQYNSVVIYCMPFHVVFSTAALQ
ncbi:MAG: DM13 domain-containing protein [Chloroflexales bacterium]|nr:DM13 domain-containing protein [Chloroflexales bacterium]